MTWPQIRTSNAYRGRWVALDNCRYDARTAQPVEGTIVDADDDLAELCARIRQNDSRYCAILFCDDDEEETPAPASASRPTLPSVH